MAAPYPVFGPRWEFAVTDVMAFQIARSAARQGIAKSEWIREACQQRIDRERPTPKSTPKKKRQTS